jgi:8-oxo-dGTP diphosphatase
VDVRRFAGVIAVHDGRIALVREHHERWGGAFWNIPSGMVEDHESLHVGAARELAEETGLVVPPGALELVGTSSTKGQDRCSLAWNFTTHVGDPRLAVDDPDGQVLEARWFTRDQAVALLEELPYRPLREPVIAHLTARTPPGSHWHFEGAGADPVVTSA